MDVQERFYGEAMREIEQGLRREDLWVKAMARSEGDLQKAKALYVELLARLLSDAHSNARMKEMKGASVALAKSTGRKMFYITRLVVVMLVFFGLSGSLFEIIRGEYRKHYANTYPYSSSRDDEAPLVYTNSDGHSLTALTGRQCYEVVAAGDGYGYDKLSDLQRDLVDRHMDSIRQKYRSYIERKQPDSRYYTNGNLGDDLTSCISNAGAEHFNQAIRTHSWSEVAMGWPVLFFPVLAACLLAFLLLTKFLVKPLTRAGK
ncbi:hypothetical protein [Azospirillum sp. Sh1]|uniref:hypothetical protein n=1 Tax=Azospirillum sp. Sh1 TaxID=2607285 RepID=UPI0011ECFCCD|nr:hypothetical protein [Azospirillum sp. Sh1]KAA0573380.1 hypothetical protein FZ029_20595 [Azospirillum sp. Sh1]